MHLPIFWITCFSWSCLLQLGSGVLSLDFEISGVKGLRVHWKGGWICLVPFSLSVDQRRSTKTLTWNNTTIRGNIYDFCLFHFFFLPVLLLISPKKPQIFAPDLYRTCTTGQVFSPMGRGVAPPPPALPPLEEPRSECYKLFCGCDKTPCFLLGEE